MLRRHARAVSAEGPAVRGRTRHVRDLSTVVDSRASFNTLLRLGGRHLYLRSRTTLNPFRVER
jgi:hypothetical protein